MLPEPALHHRRPNPHPRWFSVSASSRRDGQVAILLTGISRFGLLLSSSFQNSKRYSSPRPSSGTSGSGFALARS